MQKIKFRIKGMHCNSCALLIEEKLKSAPGIIKVKVGHDSERAVIVYDEQKIQESDIKQVIRDAGDYQVERIEEKEEGSQDRESIPVEKEALKTPLGKSTPSGFLTILVVVSFGLSIISLVTSFESLSQKGNSDTKSAVAAAGQNLPSQPNPSAQQPSSNDANATIQNFDIKNTDHIRGNINAPITLVEFSDFECPFCERIYPTLNKILSDYKDKVRLVYKYFPLSFHPNSQKAAESAECASEQGKFWEYHDKLFDNQASGFSVDKFKQWAKDLGLNSVQFNDCLDSGKYAGKVQADLQEGIAKGVNGTPTTFINGQLISGAQPYEAFKQIIDQLLPKS